MRTRILTIMAAFFCLLSCSKHEIVTPTPEPETDNEYRIEITGTDATKGSAATVSLNLADLTMTSSKTVTAQLKKKSGTDWVDVNSGVTYTWSATSTDSQKFSGSGTTGQACTVAAKAQGSGTITVAASLSGSTVATQGVPVVVSDNRAITWTNATTTGVSGTVYSAVLNSNFSGTVTVSSDNGSFLVGTSSASLAATANVTFSSGTTQTIYYEYTGSEETTINLDAVSGDIVGEVLSIETELATLKPKSIAVVTTSTMIPYTGDDTDAKSLAQSRNFYFQVTYEDDSVKEIKSDANFTFDCKYPYATICSMTDNPGHFYIKTNRTSAQGSRSTATAYIIAYYTENGVTVQTSFTLSIYNWVKYGGKSGTSLLVTYGDGVTILIASNSFYYNNAQGSTIFGWPTSTATNITPVFYIESQYSASLGNFYILDGTFGIPAFQFTGTDYTQSNYVYIYSKK